MHVTNDTVFADIKPGDIMPDGKTVVKAEISAPGSDGRQVVALAVQDENVHGAFVRDLAAEWAHETWGEAVARAEHMRSLVDHS